MLIDARGQACPKPVLMAEEALSKLEEGIVDVLVDNEASVGNLSRFATKNAFYSETIKEDNYWRVKIVKGYPCEVPIKEEEKEPEKDILLIIGSDVMGKEEELGRILMKAFFETMKVYKELPHTIFFLNAGVKLTTVNEEIYPIIKEIADMGVEIYSCGTCLKHYNLESELKVGHRGTTNHIIEGLKDFKKTVWIG
ncbi:sulfurtransferase-like selenium metabolism protein YedF [Dissulfurispira sp.]|uniref:sulfurtransferase-like selenium metabolism protein YedF n=1 Tax=Dissulfurispira sp. TaxID=2817609 RepID=UPI002FD8A0CC